ncbi:hypothetical protein [Trinickia diaoshuihuensis]|uniref:hypothetical protein n=1 Tax=Trinickia diaoshuihuensis TaxID=2292265 RepID=UPI000E265D8B|nr:hypothetical protein [Trinickia diaoshuihuensis]
MHLRTTLTYWGALAVWSICCAVLSQWHFQHMLVICEQVEALYHGMADDATVSLVMRTFVVVLWAAGAGVLTICWQVFGLARCDSGR